jgi:tetratricopeptide (TPR) repeat protein
MMARAASPDWCFPARLDELPLLEWAATADPDNARIRHYLGNWLYDRRRHREAIIQWDAATRLDADYSVTWRNLGIARFNILGKAAGARTAYDRAIAADPEDARLWYERDQLWARTGVSAAKRLKVLSAVPALVARRDDLTVAMADLLCQAGRHAEAEALLLGRRFQPWEGGEGQALAVWRRAHLAQARAALAAGDAATAIARCQRILDPPTTLGEQWHLLQNLCDVWCLLGDAQAAAGDRTQARVWWTKAAEFRGDFTGMRVQAWSALTLYAARANERLGRRAAAKRLLTGLAAHAKDLERQEARIDYFATSLPTMLLFHDDLQARQVTAARFLAAQAALGLGRRAAARKQLAEVLRRDPGHALAADLLAEA